jgi:hypothetical protein
MGDTCTCDARLCNYNKEGGYGFDTKGALIDPSKNLKIVSEKLNILMDPGSKDSLNYFKTSSSTSAQAFNALRENIRNAAPIPGLTMQAFCVDVEDSYKKLSAQKFQPSETIKEGYAPINPPTSSCSTIICIIVGIILFGLAIYAVYKYINCPCRKRNEKALQEALDST